MHPQLFLHREIWKKLISEFMPDKEFTLFLQDVIKTKFETGLISEEAMERLLRRGLRYLLVDPESMGMFFGFEANEYYQCMGENKTKFRPHQILPLLPEFGNQPQNDLQINDALRVRIIDDGSDASIFKRPYLVVYDSENSAVQLENLIIFGVKLND